MEKRVWLKLAEAFLEDNAYLEEVNRAILAAADKHGICKDFLGLPFDGGRLSNAVLEVLGHDFSHWLFECDKDFVKYNESTEIDGVHPNVDSLEGLYDLTEGRLECVSS